ncbi:MAG: thiamine phosphate synthase [Desulfofustis sp.]|jgi:thiamine-phosphate pyrophosphorylase|nr:thiamine phosphate synthase [Desulfofustis sp.]
MKPIIDYRLYLVTDRSQSRGRSNVEVVAAAVDGGVCCVQLREKECSTREFLREAKELMALLQPRNIPLIINDRLDIALAVGAAGVHLGQNDLPLREARHLGGDRLIIGVSAESIEDAMEAEAEGADYLGLSPVFATATKKDHAPPLGLSGVAAIRARTGLPLVAIGGINAVNGAAVLAAGADGIAVVSAIVAAADPTHAARELHRLCRPDSRHP